MALAFSMQAKISTTIYSCNNAYANVFQNDFG